MFTFNLNTVNRQSLFVQFCSSAALTCVGMFSAGRMGLQLEEALFWIITLSRMAFLALCSFFLILQYSRFLFRKSSSDSPGTGFGGTMVLTGTSLVGVCAARVGLWNWAHGFLTGLRGESGVWPGGSMGCRLMLDRGLSGGFRVWRQGAESVLVDIHVCGPGTASSWRFSGASR